MSKDIEIQGNTAFLPKAKATVFMESGGNSSPKTNHTATKLDNANNPLDYARWGSDNKWPQTVIEKLSKSSVGKRGLRFNSKAHYGRGISLVKEDFSKGETKLIAQPWESYPEIKGFMDRVRHKRFLKEMIEDFEWFMICFPEMIPTNDYSQIYSVRHLEAAFCRWKKTETGVIEKMFYSPKWGTVTQPAAIDLEEVPVIDPWLSPEQAREWMKKNRVKKFIYPTFYPTPGRQYYPDADWHTVVRNGWIEVASAIPELKKKMHENQLNIKYHIKIPVTYWQTKYPEWKRYDEKAQQSRKKDTLEEFDDFLTGSNNAYKTFISEFAVDKIKGTPMPGWEITPIEDPIKDGKHIIDSQAANSEILFALGVDLTLIGAGFPGGKLGAGSGSDKREAFNIYFALKQADREVTLEPFEFIKNFNGWPQDLHFKYNDWKLTPLNENKSGIQNTEQPDMREPQTEETEE